MAVSVCVFVKIVLVTLVRWVKTLQRLHLYGDGSIEVLLLLGENTLNDRQIGLGSVIHASPVACPLIVPLLVEAGGVDGFEEHPQEERQIDHGVVILDAHGLGIARHVGIDFLISRVVRLSVGEAHLGVRHAFYLLEIMLGAPKAAASKKNIFGHKR